MTTETAVKHLPLHKQHQDAGARFIQFASWEVPVFYSSIIDEHETVRKGVGLFDVSHMGEVRLKGPKAKEFLNYLLPNRINKLSPGKGIYSPMLNESGGIVDDLIVYQLEEDNFLVIINAGNVDKDHQWITSHLPEEGVEYENISAQRGILAIQGPKGPDVVKALFGEDLGSLARFEFRLRSFQGKDIVVSRTGYTGEDGFELFIDNEVAEPLFEEIFKAGKAWGIKPIGFGARDTLRLESCLLLHGHDMSDTISPLEAPLKWTIDLDKENFIGKDALLKQLEEGVQRKIVGFEMVDRGLARENYVVKKDEKEIGFVTSGSHSPSLNKKIGLALIDISEAKIDNEISIVIRDQAQKAKIVKMPFYKTV